MPLRGFIYVKTFTIIEVGETRWRGISDTANANSHGYNVGGRRKYAQLSQPASSSKRTVAPTSTNPKRYTSTENESGQSSIKYVKYIAMILKKIDDYH